MIKYQFTEPRRMDTLPNGCTRCYYNETVSEETITTTDQETGEETSETHPVYGYEALDLEGPVTKAALVNALIRLRYSQSDVEAIMRHAIAGAAGAAEEFTAFDAYAEACKAEANRILQLG